MDESNKKYQKLIAKLHRLTTLINTYKHPDRCVDYLNGIDDKKVFLIVSYDLSEQLVERVHDKSVLNSIYIFSEGSTDYIQPQDMSLFRSWRFFNKKIEYYIYINRTDMTMIDRPYLINMHSVIHNQRLL